jgi:integrase
MGRGAQSSTASAASTCTKTHQDRDLPRPRTLAAPSWRICAINARIRVFEPGQPPFTAARSYDHVGNTVRSLLMRAGVVDRGVHALRHTAATAMVNGGASFKDVADGQILAPPWTPPGHEDECVDANAPHLGEDRAL